MAVLSWKTFFEKIDNYFYDKEPIFPLLPDVRTFFIEHFCGPAANKLTQDRYDIYKIEGARASYLADYIDKAVVSAHSEYAQYVANKSQQNLTILTTKILNSNPKLGGGELVQEAIAEYIAKMVAWDWLNRTRFAFKLYKDFCAGYDEIKTELRSPTNNRQKNLDKFNQLIRAIYDINPLIKKGSEQEVKQVIHAYLLNRREHELQHPMGVYLEPYVAPSTVYARVTTPLAEKIGNMQRLKQIPMPTFANTVGLKILLPQYWLDGLSSIFCLLPAKAICGFFNWTFGANSRAGQVLKCLIAGPFLLGKIITFSLAKLLSIDGISELCGYSQDHVQPISSQEAEGFSMSSTPPAKISKPPTPTVEAPSRNSINGLTLSLDDGPNTPSCSRKKSYSPVTELPRNRNPQPSVTPSVEKRGKPFGLLRTRSSSLPNLFNLKISVESVDSNMDDELKMRIGPKVISISG